MGWIFKIVQNTIKRTVLEWTEINGKRVPKRVIDIIPKNKLPKNIKNNGELIEEIFKKQ